MAGWYEWTLGPPENWFRYNTGTNDADIPWWRIVEDARVILADLCTAANIMERYLIDTGNSITGQPTGVQFAGALPPFTPHQETVWPLVTRTRPTADDFNGLVMTEMMISVHSIWGVQLYSPGRFAGNLSFPSIIDMVLTRLQEGIWGVAQRYRCRFGGIRSATGSPVTDEGLWDTTMIHTGLYASSWPGSLRFLRYQGMRVDSMNHVKWDFFPVNNVDGSNLFQKHTITHNVEFTEEKDAAAAWSDAIDSTPSTTPAYLSGDWGSANPATHAWCGYRAVEIEDKREGTTPPDPDPPYTQFAINIFWHDGVYADTGRIKGQIVQKIVYRLDRHLIFPQGEDTPDITWTGRNLSWNLDMQIAADKSLNSPDGNPTESDIFFGTISGGSYVNYARDASGLNDFGETIFNRWNDVTHPLPYRVEQQGELSWIATDQPTECNFRWMLQSPPWGDWSGTYRTYSGWVGGVPRTVIWRKKESGGYVNLRSLYIIAGFTGYA